GGHQREDRVDLLPEDVRVEQPGVFEPLRLGKLGQVHPPAGGRIRCKTDVEAESCHFLPKSWSPHREEGAPARSISSFSRRRSLRAPPRGRRREKCRKGQ